MLTRVTTITVVVKDQKEALEWYTEKLGFVKRMDAPMGRDARWITVAPPEQEDLQITLAHWKWYGNKSKSQVGKGTTVVVQSTDCKKDYKQMKAKGVKFTDAPSDQPWGVSAVFLDLYGNPYNLLQPKT